MFRRLTLIGVVCGALSACGSGGSAVNVPAVPGTSSVAIAIKIPNAPSSVASIGRRPLYISSSTQSVSIAINGGTPVVANLTTGSPNCTSVTGSRTCTLTVNAPVGRDSFAETLYAGTGATGAILSQGKTSATIVAGTANVVDLTLSGVIASILLTLSNATPPQGPAAIIPLTVNFTDAGGFAIIGSDPFVTPVKLTSTDNLNATLSQVTLASPADASALTVTYSGAAIQATIGASAGSIIAPNVTLAPVPPVPVNFNDYATFGYDNQRDVFNPNTTAITPATLANIRLAWQTTLGNGDFNTQTQPILATGIAGHAGVLYVGGGTGRVYSYDALTGASMKTRTTGQEIYTCENSSPIYFGVGGTVAYDAASKSLYVVGNANSVPDAVATNSLYKLDATTLAVLGQVDFAPSDTGWPSLDFSHTSVTLSNGIAYVGTGATCDISSWRGRIVAINVATMTVSNTFYPVWNGTSQPWGGGGIWGWGGVSLDFDGSVLTGVGNTDNGLTTHGNIVLPFVRAPQEYSGLGEAFIKVSADLSTVVDQDHPIPSTAYTGASVDLDIQGTPAVFRPNGVGCDPMAALQAKSGTLYLYDTLQIHGRGVVAQYQLAPSTYADGFLGGPAYSPATGLLYAAVTSSGFLYPPGMIAIDPGCGTPSVLWHSSFGPDSYPSGVPRSVPAASAGGVVFVGTWCSPDGSGSCSGSVASTPTSVSRTAAGAPRKPRICCTPPGTGGGALWALDASTGTVLNGGKPLIYTSGPLRVPPTIDGNWIFVLDNNGSMYGLTIDTSFPAVAAKNRAIDARMLRHWETPGK